MTFSQKAVEAATEAYVKSRCGGSLPEYCMRDALTAALAVDGVALQGWQPIESAPHNTRVILAWRDWRDDTWLMEVGPATTGQRFENGCSNLSQHGSATHWQPLPPPPAASDREERR